MFIAEAPSIYSGQVIGNGHCVAFVRHAATAPHTSQWRRGAKVRGYSAAPGLAIATFDADGRYGNHIDGSSHAAILIAVMSDGLSVWDQWEGHPVARRVIRFKGGVGPAVNDGDRYFSILAAADELRTAEPASA
jgi:hypothetical protein